MDDHLEVEVSWKMPGNVQVFMNEGLNSLEEGDLSLSITNFDKVIKLDSSQWTAYYYRGVANKKTFQFDKAEQDFTQAIRLNPLIPETYLELGEIYHYQEFYNKAETVYKKAIDVKPTFVYAYFNLGNLYAIGNDLRKAQRQYQRCNEIDPTFPDAYLMLGILKFYVKKDDDHSIEFFDKAIKVDSAFSQAFFWRGLANLSLNKPDRTVADWNTLVKYNPGNSFYTLIRGFLYIELNDFDKAFVDLRKGLQSVSVNEDKFKGAQTAIDKRIDLHAAADYLIATGYGLGDEAFQNLKKGFCLLLSERRDQAIESLQTSIKIQQSAVAHYLLGVTYEHMGKHNFAYQEYTIALAMDDDIFDAHKKRSVYRSELKDWSGANEDFNAMFRLRPESPVTYRLRGLAKSNQADYEGAINDLAKFIETDSSDFESLRTRSVCYSLLKKNRKANDDLRRILRIRKKDGQLYDDVAKNYLTLNDTASAVSVLQDFADAMPTIFVPFFLLSEIYINQHQWEKAKAEIDLLLPLLHPTLATDKYSQAVFWQGLIEFENKRYENAIFKCTEALEHNKKNLDARYIRAKAYQQSGEVKKAASDFKDLSKEGFKDAQTLYLKVKNLPEK